MTDQAPVSWPWWMGPARLVGRLRPVLVAAAAADRRAIDRILPRSARALVPVVVLLVAAAFAGSHAAGATAYSPQGLDWLRVQIDTVFTESPLFLVVACVLGAWSPTAGVLFVLGYGVLDLGAASLDRWEMSPLPTALAARLIGMWILWLLVVEIPVAGRTLALSIRRPTPNRVLVVVVAAVVTGLLTWVWTQVTPVLIRPLYLWSSMADIERSAVMPVQLAGGVFALVAAAAAAVRAWYARPEELLDAQASAAVPPRPSRSPRAEMASRLAVAGLLTIALGGLVTTPLDAVVLFVALVGAGPLAQWIATRTLLGGILRRLPPLAQAVLAAVLAYGVSLAMVGGIVPTWHAPSEFFSVIVAFAVGLFLVRLVTAGQAPRTSPARPGPITAGTTLALVLLGLSALAPVTVLADNCASFMDCWGTPFLGALVAGGLPLLMAAASWSQPPPPHYVGPGTRLPDGSVLGPDQPPMWMSDQDWKALEPSWWGSKWSAVKKWLGGKKYEVTTERAVSGVRG